MLARCRALPAAIGRLAPLPPHALAVGSPLLWTALWGVTVFDGAGMGTELWLAPGGAAGIAARAKSMLLAALERSCAELESHRLDGDAPGPVAERAVVVLQAVLLAMLVSERAGAMRAMVGLVSLAIRFALLSAIATRNWIARVSSMLAEDRSVPGDDSDLMALDAWMASWGISPVVPASESLCFLTARPSTLRALPPPSKHEIVLLARFAACFIYCVGIENWSAELVGSAVYCTGPEVAHVPLPFDTRLFGDGSFTGMPPFYVSPVSAMGPFIRWCDPATDAHPRALILRATVTDMFRVGNHFLSCVHNNLIGLLTALRSRVRAAGFPNIYPEACLADPSVRAEMDRLSALLEEVAAAYPPEMSAAIADGSIGEMVGMFESCPSCCALPVASWMVGPPPAFRALF
ncbi:hypothetical protein DFJ74DRAFT_695526 [Hyaloraphidium curvatum]|nr:hypothetical protein DFJ74DRAFT_695526 [Hyaloraphidium curvatum]